MKYLAQTRRNVIAITAIALYAIAASPQLSASEAPWISPNTDYVIGVDKTLDVYCGGGSSDKPDHAAPCPPWTLSSDTEVWNWPFNGPGTKSGDEDQITVTATAVGEITVSVNRNDTYSDESQPDSSTESGVVSADSETLTIHSVKPTDNQPSKKWYYFNNPQLPIPTDAEECHFSIEGSTGNAGSISWEASSQRASFSGNDPGGSGQGSGMDVTGTSSGTGQVEIKAKWGSADLGSLSKTIYSCANVWKLGQPTQYSQSITWFHSSYVYKCSWIFEDEDTDPIANVGLNEIFGDRNDLYSENTWSGFFFDRNAVLDDSGGALDTYGYSNLTYGLVPSMTAHGASGDSTAVFSLPQEYRVGTMESGEGQLAQSHTVTWRRGKVTVD